MFFSRIPLLAMILGVLAVSSSGCERAEERRGQVHPARARESDARRPAPAEAPDGARAQAGLRYIEVVTGGASAADALPMIAFFHGHGGRPEGFRSRFASFKERARIILPYGVHESGNAGYEWFPAGAFRPGMQERYAEALPAVESRVAEAISAIAKARPTVGKPIAAGFSQGAGLTLALALRHPDLLAAGCPMAGQVPAQVFDGVKAPATRPELHAFIGDADPNEASARRTIETFRSLGYVADIAVLPGFGHAFAPAQDDVFGCLERAVHHVTR